MMTAETAANSGKPRRYASRPRAMRPRLSRDPHLEQRCHRKSGGGPPKASVRTRKIAPHPDPLPASGARESVKAPSQKTFRFFHELVEKGGAMTASEGYQWRRDKDGLEPREVCPPLPEPRRSAAISGSRRRYHPADALAAAPCSGIPTLRGSQVRNGLSAGGRWIRTSGSWSRDRQTVMGEVTAFSKPGRICWGTGCSNPSPSSEESAANLTFGERTPRRIG